MMLCETLNYKRRGEERKVEEGGEQELSGDIKDERLNYIYDRRDGQIAVR